MTIRERDLSAVRGDALRLCIELSRSGEYFTDDTACDLARALTGCRGVRLHDPIYTNGGAVVRFLPVSKVGVRYTVQVSASPI